MTAQHKAGVLYVLNGSSAPGNMSLVSAFQVKSSPAGPHSLTR